MDINCGTIADGEQNIAEVIDDLETAVRYYGDGLGLKTEGIIGQEFEYGAVTFLDLQAGLKLAVSRRRARTG